MKTVTIKCLFGLFILIVSIALTGVAFAEGEAPDSGGGGGGGGANNDCLPEKPNDTECYRYVQKKCKYVPECKAAEGEVCCVEDKKCSVKKKEDCCDDESCKGTCPRGKGSASGSGGGGGTGNYGVASLARGATPPTGLEGEAMVRILLGAMPGGDSAGWFTVRAIGATPDSVRAQAGLSLLVSMGAGVYINDSGGQYNYVMAPLTDVKIVESTNTFSYELHFYDKGIMDGAGHVPSGTTPAIVWRVWDPDQGTNGYRRLNVSKTEDSRVAELYEYQWEPNTLILTSGNGLRTERITWTHVTSDSPGSTLDRIDTHEILNPNGSVAERIVRTYGRYRFGDKLVLEKKGAVGDEIVSKRISYYWDETAIGRFGKIKSEEKEDGSWVRYDYDVEGRKIAEVTPWLDSELGDPDGVSKVTLYDYVCLDSRETPARNDRRWRTKMTFISNVWVSATYRAYVISDGIRSLIEEEAGSQTALYGDVSNRRTVTEYATDPIAPALKDQPLSIVHPNGVKDVYEYRLGDYIPSPTNTGLFVESADGAYIQATETKDALRLRPMKSVKTIRVLDAMGKELQSETWLFTGNDQFVRMDWTTTTRDDQGRELVHRFANGLTRETTWDCCGKASEIQPDGQTMLYSYDMLGREVMQTKVGLPSAGIEDVTVLMDYDAAGHILKQTLTAGTLSMVSSNQYDVAGRLVQSWGTDGLLTTTRYDDELTQASILPGGAIRTVARYRDGQAKSVTGTAQTSVFYTYGIEPDGSQWTCQTLANENGSVWTLSVRNREGKAIRAERPGFGGVVLTNLYLYDADDHLIQETADGSPDRLYVYNEYDEMVRSGLDVDGDGELTPASMDRIQESRTEYVQEDDLFFRQTVSVAYPFDQASTAVTTSVSRVQVGGTGCACEEGVQETIDARGNLTRKQTLVNAALKIVTTITTRPTSATPETSVKINGLLAEQTTADGLTYRYEYDDLGRQVAAIDPRTGTNETVYLANGWVDYTEDAAGNRTTYQYDFATGRRIAVVDALSQTNYTAYDIQGRVTNTYGTTYPVAYRYDAYGRMSQMETWRDAAGTADATQWLYDEATGLLTNKVYADGLGPVYEYDATGRLTKRTWARGVETDYAYDALGQLLDIEYSDDTPPVSFTYDRMGRQVTVTDILGTRTNIYDGIFGVVEEQLPNGDVLTRSYDTLGRSTGFDLNNNALAVDYAYDGFGRFESVAWAGDEIDSAQTEYAYLPDSRLLSGWTLSGPSISNAFQVVKTYEPHRDLLLGVSNGVVGGGSISTFQYQNDAIGRRTARMDNGAVSNIFGYNGRSELTSAVMDTNLFSYLYDDIGNRKEASANSVMTTYEANELNQYTEVELVTPVNPTYDADGNLINDGRWEYTWDAENRLVQARYIGRHFDPPTITFEYDYMGRLVHKYYYVSMSVLARRHYVYVYDGWNRIQERNWPEMDNENIKTNVFVWGLDLSGSLQGAGGVGGLLAVSEGQRLAVHYPFYDGNGNITDWMDADGALAAHHEYDPYGNETTGNAPASFGFSTKPLDSTLGLYYYGYRFYRPEWGRWINRDPIEEFPLVVLTKSDILNFDLSWVSNATLVPRILMPNLYNWVNNAPFRHYDFLGLTKGGWRKWQKCEKPKEWTDRPGRDPPTSNGCSFPEKLKWLLPEGGTENDPTGQCSFESACDYHDLCYARCYMTKAECDFGFHTLMNISCEICAGKISDESARETFLADCYKWSDRYAWGVDGRIGESRYKDAQTANCECRCPEK